MHDDRLKLTFTSFILGTIFPPKIMNVCVLIFSNSKYYLFFVIRDIPVVNDHRILRLFAMGHRRVTTLPLN